MKNNRIAAIEADIHREIAFVDTRTHGRDFSQWWEGYRAGLMRGLVAIDQSNAPKAEPEQQPIGAPHA